MLSPTATALIGERHYQLQLVRDLVHKLKRQCCAVLALPPGQGKTRVGNVVCSSLGLGLTLNPTTTIVICMKSQAQHRTEFELLHSSVVNLHGLTPPEREKAYGELTGQIAICSADSTAIDLSCGRLKTSVVKSALWFWTSVSCTRSTRGAPLGREATPDAGVRRGPSIVAMCAIAAGWLGLSATPLQGGYSELYGYALACDPQCARNTSFGMGNSYELDGVSKPLAIDAMRSATKLKAHGNMEAFRELLKQPLGFEGRCGVVPHTVCRWWRAAEEHLAVDG